MANENRPSQQKQQNQPSPERPPAGPVAPPATNWIEQAESYLVANGWEKQGSNERGVGIWSDPQGSRAKAEPTEIVRLPRKDGGVDIYKQFVGPSCPWTYVTEDALFIQRQREAAGGAKSPLERLEALELRFNQLSTKYDRLVAVVERVGRLPVPEKREGFAEQRGILSKALSELAVA